MKQDHFLRLAPAALGVTFLAGAASAQTNLQTLLGDKANDRLGHVVRSAGDVNQDGTNDFIVGAPENGFVFSAGEGFARVYSGATGATLWTFNGQTADDGFGLAVDGIGDVNGDGRSDLIIGAPFVNGQFGRVYVQSGATGANLYTINGQATGEQFGNAVAGVGDVNNDGVPDFAGGTFVANGGGTLRGLVRVYSGATGLLIGTINGSIDNERTATSFDGLGDLNGDGRSEIVIGSYFGGAKVYTYNGTSFSVLHTFPFVSNDDRFGFAVANAGDVSGDGLNDILVSAPQDGNFFAPGNGYVRVYNGVSGSLIRTLTGGAAGDRFGISVASARDMDGDGKAETIVGADQQGTGSNGYARLFKGSDGSVVGTLTGLASGSRCGASVDGLGDINANGDFEVIVGMPERSVPLTLIGRADVWSFSLSGCPVPFTYCSANFNSTGGPALISNTGTTSAAANNLTLVATNCPANAFGLFYFGTTQVQVPFGNGNRCIGGTVRRMPTIAANGSGTATFLVDNTQPIFSGLFTAGSTWKFQFWYRDPAGGGAAFNLTNGLSITFCN